MCNFRIVQDLFRCRYFVFLGSLLLISIHGKLMAVTPPSSPTGDGTEETYPEEFGKYLPSDDEVESDEDANAGEVPLTAHPCEDLDAAAESLAFLLGDEGVGVARLRRLPRVRVQLPALHTPPPAPPSSAVMTPDSIHATPVFPVTPHTPGILWEPVLPTLPSIGTRVSTSIGERTRKAAMLAASPSTPLVLAELRACAASGEVEDREEAKVRDPKKPKKKKKKKTVEVPDPNISRWHHWDRRGGGGGAGSVGGARNMLGSSTWASSLRQ